MIPGSATGFEELLKKYQVYTKKDTIYTVSMIMYF